MQPYLAKIRPCDSPNDPVHNAPGKLLMATRAIADNKESLLGRSGWVFQG